MFTAQAVLRLSAVVALVALMPVIVRAAEPAAARVVVVQATDPDGYLKEIEKGKALMKKLEIPVQLRVWKARFVGEGAGSISVVLEFPSLTELAKAEAKLNSDAEFTAWLKGLDKYRKVISDSIYYEMKP